MLIKVKKNDPSKYLKVYISPPPPPLKKNSLHLDPTLGFTELAQ